MMLNGEITNLDKNAPEDNTLLQNKQDEVEVQGGNSTMTSEIKPDSANQNGGDIQSLLPAVRDPNAIAPDGRTARPAVSRRKLEANRRNAKKGGVNTPQGKKVSKFNAVTHGLLCQALVLFGEDQQAFETLQDSLIADLKPEGELERLLVFRIASCFWRLDRAIRVETAILQRNMDKHDDWVRRYPEDACPPMAACGLDGENLQKYLRYETAIENQLFKAWHELQRLQLARKGVPLPAPITVDLSVTRES